MQVDNYGGETFDLAVERTVRLLNAAEVGSLLNRPPDGLKWVAYESINRITNAGSTEWSEDRGLVSIWILGMMNTFGTSWVVVPFDGPREAINDAYFGRIPADRLAVRDGYALFKADGNHRSKLGIPAAHAENVVGSYSPEADILTIIDFDIPEDASRYVNSMWEMQDDPYGGDVVNSFNDGPPGVGGFYELESSSPALALKPGESYTHRHRTIHVSGDTDALDSLSETVLGVRASKIGI
jgi:hypothetical protein